MSNFTGKEVRQVLPKINKPRQNTCICCKEVTQVLPKTNIAAKCMED